MCYLEYNEHICRWCKRVENKVLVDAKCQHFRFLREQFEESGERCQFYSKGYVLIKYECCPRKECQEDEARHQARVEELERKEKEEKRKKEEQRKQEEQREERQQREEEERQAKEIEMKRAKKEQGLARRAKAKVANKILEIKTGGQPGKKYGQEIGMHCPSEKEYLLGESESDEEGK